VLQLTMDGSTHDKLRYAQELLGHQVPDGDIATDAFRCLLALGYRASEARWAIARCGEMPGATDEERVKRALAQFPQRVTRVDRSDWLPAEVVEAATSQAP